MYKYSLFIVFLITFLFSGYSVGDIISAEHQDMEFPYCYPSDSTSLFSLSQHVGKVFVLDMAASW